MAQVLKLGYTAVRSPSLRMVFNVVARNRYGHTRNISLLINPEGVWSLAPAGDVVWSYNPKGWWTNRHQMCVNGKRDDFTRNGLLSVAGEYGIRKAHEILAGVHDAVSRWPEFAANVNVAKDRITETGQTRRLHLAAWPRLLARSAPAGLKKPLRRGIPIHNRAAHPTGQHVAPNRISHRHRFHPVRCSFAIPRPPSYPVLRWRRTFCTRGCWEGVEN